MKDYLRGLKLGEDLPKTELQPADDLAILIGQTFVSLWKLTGTEGPLYKAVVVLEFALTKSIHSFQMRLLLIRIYRLLGKVLQFSWSDPWSSTSFPDAFVVQPRPLWH
jgi:N-terminal acetyltransferase B complex non-catalytic subunit